MGWHKQTNKQKKEEKKGDMERVRIMLPTIVVAQVTSTNLQKCAEFWG